MLQRAKEIKDLRVHPAWQLDVNGIKIGKYIADFSYMENDIFVVEDVKGYKKKGAWDFFCWKAKMLKAQYGLEVRVT